MATDGDLQIQWIGIGPESRRVEGERKVESVIKNAMAFNDSAIGTDYMREGVRAAGGLWDHVGYVFLYCTFEIIL